MTDQTDTTTEPSIEPPGTDQPADQLNDAGKQAIERERARRKEAERIAHESADRAAELELAELRRSVANDKELSDEQAALLTGETEEALAAHADKLLAAFKSDPDKDVRRTPRERLRSGAAPGAEPQDIAAIADDIRGGW